MRRRCNIIIARAYNGISCEVPGLIAAEPPLHLTMTERSVNWLIAQGKYVTYWDQLSPIEEDIGIGLSLNREQVTIG